MYANGDFHPDLTTMEVSPWGVAFEDHAVASALLDNGLVALPLGDVADFMAESASLLTTGQSGF